MTYLDMVQLYDIQNGYDVDNITAIFDGITIDSRIDKDIMAGCILDECGAMRTIYETTPAFKFFSDNFFKKYEWNIGKLLDSLDFEYEPLNNYHKNWTEETDIAQNLGTTESGELSRTRENTGTQQNEYDEDTVNTISAMNSSSYEPDNKSETDGQNTRTDDLKEEIGENTGRSKDENLTWDETDSHTESGMANGSYQDLIEKERKIAEFSVYNWISKKYASELMLLVY